MHRETPPSNRWTTKTPRRWDSDVGKKVHVKESNRPTKQREKQANIWNVEMCVLGCTLFEELIEAQKWEGGR